MAKINSSFIHLLGNCRALDAVLKGGKKGKQSLPHLTSIFFLVRVQIMSNFVSENQESYIVILVTKVSKLGVEEEPI